MSRYVYIAIGALLPIVALVVYLFSAEGGDHPEYTHTNSNVAAPHDMPQRCIAFSPFVGNLTPDSGMQPSPQLVDTLLDRLVSQTGFRCIMTYGVLDGLDYVFEAAKARKLKVIAIIWLDDDVKYNSRSIARGIQVAQEYPETIVRLSCGAEVRARHGHRYDSEISRCINALQHSGATQPVTTIDTWWEWCNRSWPCQSGKFGASVDWIGINIYPWWENRSSPIFPCTPSRFAAEFQIARMEDLHRVYPSKQIVLTEFGWPRGSNEASEVTETDDAACGVASRPNQLLVINDTFKKLKEHGWTGVLYEAFDDNRKPTDEGTSSNFWGICQGDPPYRCIEGL